MLKKTLSLTLLFVLTATAAVAATINVPGDYATIQEAISAASPGDTILVAPGTFVETGQIVINKNLSIVGSGSYQTTIKPAQDTGNSGDSRGWILVQSGKHLNLSRVSLDASGRNVYQAIRVLGTATVTDCAFSNIRYAKYLGMALATMGNVSVLRCRFSNIERVGALLFGGGVTDAVVSGCIYSGKGDGDWLDYAFEIGGGARATISNNVITDCRGVASSDGSTSAGILATTYYGAGTTGKITGNTILNCSSGIAVGYNASDTSAVYANYNNLLCPCGVQVVGSADVNAENNWWGTIDGSEVAAKVSGNADHDPWRVVPVPQVFTFADDFAAFAFAQASPADRFMGSGAWRGYGVKSELYMTPDYLFLRPVKVNELLSISYATRKPGGQNTPDWYALIYTMPYVGGDATWYGNRLNAEPMYSYNLNAPANVWNIWSTDPGTNQLCFFDAKRTNAGFYGGPTLAQVAAGPIDWSSFPNSGGSVTHDYASQTVKYLTLATGNPWAAQFLGFIDDARVWLKSGQAAIIDLETASAADALYFTVNPGTMFVRPGDQVEVALNMSNLSAPAAGYQAFISFDTAKLTFSSGSYTAYPFGQHLTTLSPYQSGYIVASAGVLMNPPQLPTAAQSVLATLEFTAGTEGVTRVTFASAGDYEGFVSRITDTNGDPIQTTTSESPEIVIDGTAPVITCPTSINKSSDPGKCGAAINAGEATATDALAGVASIVGVRDDGKALTEDYPVGTTTITWTATDRAGNTAQCQQTVTVYDTENPVITCPGDITVYALPNSSEATVNPGTATATDNCGVKSVVGTRSDSKELDDPYPVGTTVITWIATDNSDNTSQCQQTVTVLNKNQVEITVQLEGVSAASLTREIEFQFGGDGTGPNNTTVYASVTFTGGTGTVTVDIPAGVQWTCVTAKDRQHTLRSRAALQVAGGKYVASFTDSDKLIGGDLTSDNLVDILDFGVFAGQFGTAYPGYRPWPNRDADISGDGQVGSADFSYIQTHFLNRGKALCGGAPDASAGLAMPVTSIRLRDLSRIIGPQAAYAADVNKDGVIDLKDAELFVQRSIAGAR